MILLSSQHWADKKNTYRLTPHAETLIHEFVSSGLDYCNSLVYGLPQVQTDKIQRVQNTAARLTLKQPKFCHITSVLS